MAEFITIKDIKERIKNLEDIITMNIGTLLNDLNNTPIMVEATPVVVKKPQKRRTKKNFPDLPAPEVPIEKPNEKPKRTRSTKEPEPVRSPFYDKDGE